MATGGIEKPTGTPPWPFTEATVVIEFKKEEYLPFEKRSRGMALNLIVGDIITDVKLPPPDFQPPVVIGVSLLGYPENGWYHGQLREREGVFNSQYVQFRYSRVPLTLQNVTTTTENVEWIFLCECLCVPESKRRHIEQQASEHHRRVLGEWWLLNDPAPSWRRLIARLDYFDHNSSCAATADLIRHNAEPVQDTTFTLTNAMSTLETVQQWRGLANQLGIPTSKHLNGREPAFNYFITTIPSASWQLLAGVLYYHGEKRGLTTVTLYFQRQPEPTLTTENLRTELEQVKLKHLGHILEARQEGTKEVIVEEFIMNHPAPSWKLIADQLYMYKYHAAVQSVKQKYLKVESRQLFNEAMKNGHVRSFNTVALLVGSAGSGKTCSKHVILNEQPPEVRVSTAIAERPVKVVKVLTINGLEWHRLTPMQQKEILARIMASRGKEKVDLAVPQLPTRSDSPELINKPDITSPSVPLEFSSSPKTETTQTSASRFHTTTTSARQRSGEESLEVLMKSPTTEEDFVALIDNSTGSEPIMEVNLIHLVDSGGQPQFHEVLPAFLRRRSAYIFVLNLSEELDTRPQIEYYNDKGTLICKACSAAHTNLQIFMHCIRTLQSHKFGGKAPNIFTLGTHRDLEYKCSETRDSKNRKIAEMLLPNFEDEVVYYNVRKKELIFPLNAKSPVEEDWKTAKEIRKLIMEKCSPPPDDTPLRWYGLEIALQEMAESLKRGVMSKEECFAVALRFHFDRDSFEAALQHLDQLNIIFYYPNTLPDVVFTDPQVLLDKVTELVKFSYELQNEDADSTIMAKGGEYRKFQDNALVTSDFLASDMFGKHYFSDLFTPLELVKLFRALLIFADFNDTEYFMPCLLRIISSEEVAKHHLDSSAATVPLVLHFPHGGPLLGMFCSLIVYLLSSANQFPSPWKLMVDRLGTPVCLFRNCVKFTVPKYPGTVSLVDSFSFFEVHVSSHDKFCSQLCSFVHDAVFTGLRKAAANLGYNNSQPEIAYLCPCQSEGLHPAIVGAGGDCWICTRDPNTYEDIDKKQQIWLTASAKALKQMPTSSTTAADPPEITQEPESQAVGTGEYITLSVKATGVDLEFQWQRNNKDIDGKESRFNHTRTGDTSTLHISHVRKSDEGYYQCLVKNPVEKNGKSSQRADLAVFDPPKITRNPENQSVATGTQTTFRVEATGDELQFQWQKDGIDIDSSKSRLQSNSVGNASTLRIQHTKNSDAGHYRCLVKNPVEKRGKASHEADLSVFNPPKLTRDPENQSVATGADTTFTVEATGDDLQFQWQKDGIDIDSSEPQLHCNSIGNANTLHIKDTKKSDKGHYRCLVRNPVEKRGMLSAKAIISVFDPPEITQGPENRSVATGADATFRVEAKGDGLQFQWQKDERDIIDNDSRFNFSRTEGTSKLCICNVQKSDKGHYRCLIKNLVEKSGKPSKEADLSVFDPPNVTKDLESQSVTTGTNTTFTVEAKGDELQFQWQKDGIDIDGSEPRLRTQCNSVGNASTLHIKDTKKSDKGHYRCLIKNPVEKSGKSSKEADFSVFDPPNITKDLESQSVTTGTNTTFTVEAKGDELEFQWKKDGIDIDSSEPRLHCNSVGNASTLHIKDTKKSDIGHYKCLLKNPVEKKGKVSHEAKLTVWCTKQIMIVGGVLCLLLLSVLGIASHLFLKENSFKDPRSHEEPPSKFDDSVSYRALPHSDQPAVSYRSKTGYPPDLPTLRHFPIGNGFIDIATKIGTDYELFGTFLLQDNDGNKVKTIEKSERGDPLRITVEILRQWLQGNGKLPVSWQTLVQCLRNSNLNVISDSIETSLLEHRLSNDLEHAHSDEL